MAIRVQCECGKLLAVPDAVAGKRVKCSTCGAIIDVPQAGEALAEERPPRRGAEPARPSTPRRRRYTRQRSSTGPVVALVVFLVLGAGIVVVYLALRSGQPFISHPGWLFLERFRVALKDENDDVVRNMMSPEFNRSIREGLERRKTESFVAAWMRANRDYLQSFATSQYTDEEPTDKPGRIKVTCKAPSGGTIRFYIELHGSDWLFDGFE